MGQKATLEDAHAAFTRKAWEQAYDLLCSADGESALDPGDLEQLAAAAYPGMLAVARAATPPGLSIDWYETSVEAMPLPDASFDVVLCQMGLQFFPNKVAALREVHRILAPGGRVFINLPGPTPPLFAAMADALAKNIHPDGTKFIHVVFSLFDAGELQGLMADSGFQIVDIDAQPKTVRLPPPADFLWQYVHSTPLVGAVAKASDQQKAALEQDVCERWQKFVTDGGMEITVTMTTITARK